MSKYKLLVMDVDGVLTDGRKYYDREGNVVAKTFCDKDWTAIKRFVAIGFQVLFITGDPFNEKILTNRNYNVVVNRNNGTHGDKWEILKHLLEEVYSIMPNEVIFIGDDLFDINAIKHCGLSVCPNDAPNAVKEYCDAILVSNGGENCIVNLLDYLEENELIPKVNENELMEKIYALDVKEKF